MIEWDKREHCCASAPKRPASFGINIYNGVIIKLHHRLPIERIGGFKRVVVEKRNPKTASPVRPVVRVDAVAGRQASKHRQAGRQARGAGMSGVDPARSLPSPPRRFSRRAAEEDRGAPGRSAKVLSLLSSSLRLHARVSFRSPRLLSLSRYLPLPPPSLSLSLSFFLILSLRLDRIESKRLFRPRYHSRSLYLSALFPSPCAASRE